MSGKLILNWLDNSKQKRELSHMAKAITKSVVRSVLSSSIGNVLEWYEYTLYAYFATVISNLFFPIGNSYMSMIMTFFTFAIGLAARPIGGIIFGYIGDRYSRKKMLVITMLLMSIPTLCIGLLPTYQQIGIAAPLCLVTLRILQGVALGGEFGASCVYLFESVPHKNRGFFGCLALTGVGTGLVLSACTIFIVEKFVSQEIIYAYAWRIPFFISVFGATIGFYMRRSLLETKDFIIAKQKSKLVINPFAEMLRNHKITLLSLFAIFITTQVAFFIVFIFGKSMMIKFLNYNNNLAGKFNLFTVISYTVATVFFGYLSDKINKKYIIIAGAFGIFLAIYPFISSLKAGDSSLVIFFSLLMGVFIGMTEGTLNPLVAESFPTNIRATSVAFCWNFTAVAFGGSAPIIAMWLIERLGSIDIVAYYLMFVSVITILVTLLFLRKEKRRINKSTV
jgi:MHS family proline/betaine transporter-like MFS transporter